MNNLYRELAPVTEAAWDQIEDEVKRTFERHSAARRVVDVSDAGGSELSAVGTGHLSELPTPEPGLLTRARQVQPIVEVRVPFTLSRAAIDDVERGAQDSDWQPAKDAAKKLAYTEDRIVIDGYGAANIAGIRPSSSNPAISLPSDVLMYPNAVTQAISALRLAGVNGPYSVLLSASAYTEVSETSDHGYPILEHLNRLVDGDIVWAPAIDGALVLSTRGADFNLTLGQDVSIGYLSHDANNVELYLQESLTFFAYTAEASVALT
jgi:uncharacterized linocin/CFP29 family protein